MEFRTTAGHPAGQRIAHINPNSSTECRPRITSQPACTPTLHGWTHITSKLCHLRQLELQAWQLRLHTVRALTGAAHSPALHDTACVTAHVSAADEQAGVWFYMFRLCRCVAEASGVLPCEGGGVHALMHPCVPGRMLLTCL
jgi:hypothetical protein